tara:strand:+ start:681 stop:995 length:315 start_codon:yes stop_codon:yes gene_type:complete
MSNRIILPHKAAKEDVTIYYHPKLELWTPNAGQPVTLHVYGNMSVRAGETRWSTDLVDVPEGELPFMKQKELRTLITSIKTALNETLPETKINEIMQHVVHYSR